MKRYTLVLNEMEHKLFLALVDTALKATGSSAIMQMAHTHKLLHTCKVEEEAPETEAPKAKPTEKKLGKGEAIKLKPNGAPSAAN